MKPRQYPMTVRTLGDWGDQVTLTIYCTACPHYVGFPTDELARRYGEDTLIDDFRARLKCSKCGCEEVETRLSHSGRPSWIQMDPK